MQNDLANFAKAVKCLGRCIIMNVAIIAHINNVITSKKSTPEFDSRRAFHMRIMMI